MEKLMTHRQNDPLTSACNLKIGILYNLPAETSKGESIDYLAEAEVKEEAETVRKALEILDFHYQMFPIKDDVEPVIKALKDFKPTVVVNLCEGAFGDSQQEMNVPAILELLGIPYTGSPLLSLGICQNKGLTKQILEVNGVPTPRYCILNRFEDWRGRMKYPLFVKPLKEDASLGISRKSYVRNEAELKAQVEYVNKRYGQPALVEEYIPGRELNIAILGNDYPKVLPISEIIFDFQHEPKIFDYSAKWIKDSDEYQKTTPICPANLNPSVKAKLKEVALKAYKTLRCRDYATVDIRLKEDSTIVLEVNPNPGISPDAFFAMALKTSDILYHEFVKNIIQFALERFY
jgi:D-alanine-D-alanine ligase